jgi:hypothetical protein
LIERIINVSRLQPSDSNIEAVLGQDINRNMIPDILEKEIDSNLDGVFDTSVKSSQEWVSSIQMERFTDLNLDGIPDIETLDINSNGIMDFIEGPIDITGDLVPDLVIEDLMVPEFLEADFGLDLALDFL